MKHSHPLLRRSLLAARGSLLALLGALPSCATLVEPREPWASEVGEELPGTADLDRALGRVVRDGRVDYALLLSEPEDLERYYARLARVSPRSHPELFESEQERLAYWINAYNACAMLSAMRELPLESVRDLGVPWYLFFLPDLAGFFVLREHLLGGESWSLYALENDIVREEFGDPRIHFALNCASESCPRLPAQAFRARELDQELERETRRFFAESRNLRIDHDERRIVLSQILEWYEEDFTSWLAERAHTEPSLLDYVALYAPPELAQELRGRAAEYELSFTPYDWGLNAR